VTELKEKAQSPHSSPPISPPTPYTPRPVALLPPKHREHHSSRAHASVILVRVPSIGASASMANPAGESDDGVLRLDFDRRLMLEFRGSVVPVREKSTSPKSSKSLPDFEPTSSLGPAAGGLLLAPYLDRHSSHRRARSERVVLCAPAQAMPSPVNRLPKLSPRSAPNFDPFGRRDLAECRSRPR
jgi:hypothetical protein